MEGRRKGGRKGGREGRRKGGREGGREEGREGKEHHLSVHPYSPHLEEGCDGKGGYAPVGIRDEALQVHVAAGNCVWVEHGNLNEEGREGGREQKREGGRKRYHQDVYQRRC